MTWCRSALSRDIRRACLEVGREAERRAASFLVEKGYSVLASRFRCTWGEVDLVAERGGVLCFVEVKARLRMDDALSAVTAAKRRRVVRAALSFLEKNPRWEHADFQFDVILVSGPVIEHIPCAWFLDDSDAVFG